MKMVIVCIQMIVLIALVKMDMKEMVLIVLVQHFLFLFSFLFVSLLNSIKTTKYEILIFNFNLIDIDECLTNNGGCDMNAICENTIGSRNCTCSDGFSGNGINCLGRIHIFLFSLSM